MQDETKRLWKTCGCVVLMVTLVFIGLYHAFLSGKVLYAYYDVGGDTVSSYLPNMVFDIRSLLSGSSDQYTLFRGLGGYYHSLWYKYFNPVNLPLLLFGEEHIEWGLIASLYLKYVIMAVFALLFFRRLLRDDRLAAVCALLWSFSGYAVLWGQHYQFLTHLVYITVAMYGVQLLLDGDRKRCLLILLLATMTCGSYLFVYITCFMIAAYSVLYLVFRGTKVRAILGKAGIFALSLVAAAAVSGVYVIPAVLGFFNSTRISNVTAGNTQSFVYSADYLLSFLSRLLSNDTLGTANEYSGPANYYEIAILSVSILFIFSLVLMLQSKYWKRVAAVTAVCAAALALPSVSHLLTFNYTRQRWSYLLCFGEIILIGIALRYLFTHRNEPEMGKKLLRTVCISDGVYLLLILALWLAQRAGSLDLRIGPCLKIAAFLGVYSLFFLLAPRWDVRRAGGVLLVLVCVELVVANYAAVNDRILVSCEEWYHGFYYDGTEQAAAWIQGQDDGLYRINKTYLSVSQNDQLVQDFPGTGIYNSTNPSELVELYTSFGRDLNSLDPECSTNWIDFFGNQIMDNTLLGVKYLIAGTDDPVDETFYQLIREEPEQGYAIYENRFWNGFGYLYTREMSGAAYEQMSFAQRKMALSRSYYRTDGAGEDTSETQPAGDVLQVDLIPELAGAVNCTVSGTAPVLVEGTQADMQLVFACPDAPEGWTLSNVKVTLTAQSASTIQMYVETDEYGYSEDHTASTYITSGTGTYYLNLSGYEGINSLRIDPSAVCQDMTIEAVELEYVNTARLLDNLSAQARNSVSIQQDGNTFSGYVSNGGDETGMLCLPLLYSDDWTATIDGTPVEVVNINGGLVGVEVPPGEHEISVVYQAGLRQLGLTATVVSGVLYLAGAALWWRLRGRKEPAWEIGDGVL